MLKANIYLFLFSISLFSVGQNFSKVKNIVTYDEYIHGINSSPDKMYYAFSVGGSKTVLIDSNYNRVRGFTYNFLWGGGGSDFSYDSRYFAFKKFGTPDTLVIYDLKQKEVTQIATNVNDLKFFNHSNKILLMYNGTFSIYDIESKAVTKTGIDLSNNKKGFYSAFDFSPDDSLLYASGHNFELSVFSTSSWKRIIVIGTYTSEIGNLHLSPDGKEFVFNSGNSIFIYNTETNSLKHKFDSGLKYIGEIAFDENFTYLLISGEGNTVILFDLKSLSVKKTLQKLDGKGVFGVCIDTQRKKVIVGDYNSLVEFKIE